MRRSSLPALAAAALLAALSLSSGAAGSVYLTEEEAYRWAFPDSDRRETVAVELPPAEREALGRELGRPEPPGPVLFQRFWRGQALLGHALVQEVMGKHEPITFITALGPDGKVLRVAVMVYRESRGGEVAQERWLKQFAGKRSSDALRVGRDVTNYAGATLSSNALAGGVKRALRLAAHLPPPGAGP